MSRFRTRTDWATALAQGGDDVLAHELQAERASSLGTAGRRMERALAMLENDPSNDALDEAGRLAWEFMVLREMSGLRDWPQVVHLYAIPEAVLRRMGASATITKGNQG